MSVVDIKPADFTITADFILNLSYKVETQEAEIESLKSIIKVLSEHLAILEKRNRKFTDRLRFGFFRKQTLEEELSKEIAKQKVKKQHFVLNDD